MRKLTKVILIAAAFFGAATVTNKIRFRYDWENAYCRTLMTPFTGTIWADGFSEGKFSKIQFGMSKSEVEAVLGDPLRKDCSGKGCMWVYSNQDTGTADYDRRWVVFDSTDQVTKIRHEFYID